MGAFIHTIPLGFNNVYVVRDEGVILIDGGGPQKAKAVLKALDKAAVKPHEIKLLILTHGHWDHIGSAAEIKKLTGAKIVLHQNERRCLESSLKTAPPGVTIWGKVSAKFFGLIPEKNHACRAYSGGYRPYE